MNKLGHPNTVPLSQWPTGWLKLECMQILAQGSFLFMTEQEKRSKGYPVTDNEMRDFIHRWNKKSGIILQ